MPKIKRPALDLSATPSGQFVPADDTLLPRRAAAIDWILRLSLILGALTLVVYAFLQSKIQVWQMWIDVTGVVLAMTCAFVGRRYLRRGQVETAGYWTLAGIFCAFGIGELGWMDSSLLQILIAPTLILLAAYLIHPRRWEVWIISALGFIAYVAVIEWWQPLPRVPVDTIPELTLVFSIPGIVLILGLLSRVVRSFRVGTIRRRLLIVMIAIAVVPMVFGTGVAIIISTTNAQSGQMQQLDAIAALKVAAVQTWLRDLLTDLGNEWIIDQEPGRGDIQAILTTPADSFEYRLGSSQLLRRLDSTIRLRQNFSELLLLDREGTIVVATQVVHVGRSAVNAEFFLKSKAQPTTQPPMYVQVLNEYGVMAAVPIFDSNGNFGGMLAGRADTRHLNELLAQSAGLGETGDVFLIDSSKRLLNTPRLGAIDNYVRTQAADDAINTQTNGQATYPGYRGTQVSGVYHWIPELQVALIIEQDQSEANRAGVFILTVITGVTVTIMLVAISVALVLARSIARPLTQLADIADRVSHGDLTAAAPIEREDEVGKVAQTFNAMTAQLRTLIGALESNVATRTEQLRASADVGRAVASTLNSDQLLAEVVDLITTRFGFYYAAVFTLDATGRSAVLRAATGEAGRILKDRGHRLEVGGQSMVSAAIAQRKARIALDVGTEAVRFANPLLPDTRSEIALPLVVGDQVLGALDVQSTTEAAFDENSATVLQAMADQIAVALDNAMLFAQSRQIAQQSRTLYQVSRLVSQGQVDIDETIGSVMKLVEDELNYTQWWITTLDAKREMLQSLGKQGASLRVADQLNGPAVRSALYAETLIVNDPANDPHVLGLPPERRPGIGKFVSVPILQQDKSIGALMLGRPAETLDLNESDLDVAKSLAGLVAFAIENHELNQQTQRALAELDQANRRLTGESWAAHSRRHATGLLWVSTGDQARHTTLPEVSEALRSGEIATRALNGDGQLGVAVPITLRDVTIGALRLVVPQWQYSPELCATLTSIAGHVAQAAENMRLLDETQARFARERALGEATDRIRRSSEVERILETAATELAQYLQTHAVSVHVGTSTAEAS